MTPHLINGADARLLHQIAEAMAKDTGAPVRVVYMGRIVMVRAPFVVGAPMRSKAGVA